MPDRDAASAPHRRRRPSSITCMECCRPWGVVLPRNPSQVEWDEAEQMLRDAYHQWRQDVWADDVTKAVPCPPPIKEPTIDRAGKIVFVTESTYRWFEDIGIEVYCEPDTWIDAGETPGWWAKSRMRPAVRWGGWGSCCDELEDPRDHPDAEKIDERNGLVAL